MINIHFEDAYKLYLTNYDIYYKYGKSSSAPYLLLEKNLENAEQVIVWERWGKNFYIKQPPTKLWYVFY